MWIGRETVLAMIDVDANDRGEQVFVDALGIVVEVVGMTFITEREVKIAVGPKENRAAVVIEFLVVLREEDHFRSRVGLVRVVF